VTDVTSSQPELLPSLAALRQAHVSLLQRHRAGQAAALLDEIDHLVARGSASGALLDAETERWEAQGILDYWVAVLFRARRNPTQGILQPFDPSLAPELADDRCPYRGLEAFREPQHGMFFGRSRVIAEMVARLAAGRLLIIVGPSGSGKSSLVLAGLIPALKTGRVPARETGVASDRWQYLPAIVPGIHPLDSLASLIAGSDAADARQHAAALAADPGHLMKSLDSRGAPTVVIVDQFEEVFTLCTDDNARRAFVENLLAAVQSPGPPHRVVLTMRSDFESQVAVFPALQDVFETAQYRVPPFNAAELREVIERPAQLIGLKFEEGIVDRLINEILGEPAGLPLLQFALLKLWERRDRNRVTLEAYRSVGGPLKALERSAEDLYGRLLPEEQVTARRILLRIVRPGNSLEVTSNRVLRESVHGAEPRERVDRVLDKLIGTGLLRQTGGPDPAELQIEVAHEALLRNWPRLVEWLDDERVRLRRRFSVTAAAQQWASHGKDPGGLLGGSILEEAGTYDDLDAIEREFITASQEALQRDARQKERALRLLVGLLVLVVAFAVGLGFFAVRLRSALAAERKQRNSAEFLRDAAQYQLDAAVAARAQAEQARASAATVVEAASRAVAAVEEQTTDKQVDTRKLEAARNMIRETQIKVAAYPRGPSGGTTQPRPAPPTQVSPPPPNAVVPAPAPSNVEPPRPGLSPTSLLDGIEIRARADETGGVVENTTLPLYHFKIWLEGSPDALARIKSVQYEFDHPTFRDKVQRSSDRRSRFEQGYRGWGCLSSVKVTMTAVDARVPEATVNFDMCAAVSFKYKK
jgi:energy-coupling factor transporter ATP-binding protein EcfA2